MKKLIVNSKEELNKVYHLWDELLCLELQVDMTPPEMDETGWQRATPPGQKRVAIATSCGLTGLIAIGYGSFCAIQYGDVESLKTCLFCGVPCLAVAGILTGIQICFIIDYKKTKKEWDALFVKPMKKKKSLFPKNKKNKNVEEEKTL